MADDGRSIVTAGGKQWVPWVVADLADGLLMVSGHREIGYMYVRFQVCVHVHVHNFT